MPSPILPPSEPTAEPLDDYFVDLIQQLADRARELGEHEVAIHLEAAAAARRHALRTLRSRTAS